LGEVVGSGTDHLPPAPVRVGLTNNAQIGLGSLGETDMGSVEDRAYHPLATKAAIINPMNSQSSQSNSEYE
jgi:hypothetical protein